MAYKTLALDEKRPRNVDLIKKGLPLNKGIHPYYFAGALALLIPLIPMIVLIMQTNSSKIGFITIIVSFFIAEAVAIFLLYQGNKIYQRRLNALVDGVEIKAQIIKHSRMFVFWKIRKNYTLTVEFEYHNKRIQHQFQSSDPLLHEFYPKDSEILGLYDSKKEAIFFPPEFGIQLESYARQGRVPLSH